MCTINVNFVCIIVFMYYFKISFFKFYLNYAVLYKAPECILSYTCILFCYNSTNVF